MIDRRLRAHFLRLEMLQVTEMRRFAAVVRGRSGRGTGFSWLRKIFVPAKGLRGRWHRGC